LTEFDDAGKAADQGALLKVLHLHSAQNADRLVCPPVAAAQRLGVRKTR